MNGGASAPARLVLQHLTTSVIQAGFDNKAWYVWEIFSAQEAKGELRKVSTEAQGAAADKLVIKTANTLTILRQLCQVGQNFQVCPSALKGYSSSCSMHSQTTKLMVDTQPNAW